METTNRKAGFVYHIPEDTSDEVFIQMKSSLETLNRNQLQMLVCVLIQEILRLKYKLGSQSTSILDPGKNNGSCQSESTQAETNCSIYQKILAHIPNLSHFQIMNLGEIKQQENFTKNAQSLIFGVSNKDIISNNEVTCDGSYRESTKINVDAEPPCPQTNQMSPSMDNHTFVGLSDQNHVKEITDMEFHEDLLALSSRKSRRDTLESGTTKLSLEEKHPLQHDVSCKNDRKFLQNQMKDKTIEQPRSVIAMDNNRGKSHNFLHSKQKMLPQFRTDAVLTRDLSRSAKINKVTQFDENTKCTTSKQCCRDIPELLLGTADGKECALSCCLCQANFQSRLVLIDHMKTEHKTAQYFCLVCDKSFMYKHNLKIHQRNKHNRTTVLCSYCGKLVLQTRLEIHMEKVHEKPLFTCHICQKGFLKRECLEGHINKHSNTKPYICECCGRKYAYSTSLSSHKKLCSRASMPPHLQNLQNSDNKSSSFICEVCGMKFEGVSGLKDHINAKHCNKSQTCNFCGKEFQWRPSYNRHVKKCRDRTDVERERCKELLCLKSVGKQFVCVCGKLYLYRQSYRRHEKNCSQKQEIESYMTSAAV